MKTRRSTTLFFVSLSATVGWIVTCLLAFGYVEPIRSTERQHTVFPVDENNVVNLVSPHYPLARAGDDGWDYHKVLTEDVNGNGDDETVHVIANVSRYDNRPHEYVWDDGHVWQVYVEDKNGNVTYLFSGWVQLGLLRVVMIDHHAYPDMRGIGIVSEQGAGVHLYRAHYRRHDDVTVYDVGHLPILREAEQRM